MIIKQNKKLKLICLTFAMLLIIGFVIYDNIFITTTYYSAADSAIPESFDGKKIAVISDLHSRDFGKNNKMLIDILKRENPYIIVMPGDLIDCNNGDFKNAINFTKAAVEIAPCYFVTGNHEAWLGNKYKLLEDMLLEVGVTIIHDSALKLTLGEESIQLLGIDDPIFEKDNASSNVIAKKLDKIEYEEGYKILLSHRPEEYNTYLRKDVNLILCGHAHGGQFRLPFIGGLFAPNQGIFPKYDGGEYTNGSSKMIVSRGLGNSLMPIRLNNPPEVVIVTLNH